MGIINTNFRNLQDKTESHLITDEQLVIDSSTLQARLLEQITNQDISNFYYLMDANGTQYTPSADRYLVDPVGSLITFNAGWELPLPLYARYNGEGSIIWAQDVKDAYKAIEDLSETALSNKGSVTLNGTLNLSGNIITDTGTINGINLTTHNHTNGQGNPIPTAGIENSAVISVKLADAAVTSSKLADNAVTYGKIANNAVSTLKIADGAVTSAKLAPDVLLPTATINALFDAFYPVGSIYTTASNANTCPLASVRGTWVEVGQGRVLQGADTNHPITGDTVEAGLPNITGGFNGSQMYDDGNGVITAEKPLATGAFEVGGNATRKTPPNSGDYSQAGFSFDASKFNAIYGASDTVQPPAYIVKFWRRTE